MDEKIKIVFFGICGDLAALSENYGIILLLCCAFILIDLLTGLAKAKLQGRINSSVGYRGFWRKVTLVAALVFGICLDALIEYVNSLGMIASAISSPVGKLLALYIAVNECISICENLIACGVRLPHFITAALNCAQDDLDQLGEVKV